MPPAPGLAFEADVLDDADERFKKEYEVLEKQLLGQGTYGQVYLARQKGTGKMVAAKQMVLDAQEEGVPSTALRELAFLKELSEGYNHPNVVKLLDAYLKPSKLVLVFEYVDSDLKKYMKAQNGTLKPERIKHLLYQLCRGVKFCHQNQIIHRDLKPANLLISADTAHLKIADFGLARTYTATCPKYTHEVVTVWYRPPEILLGIEIYSVPVDMWSVGCIFAEMAGGVALFAGDSEIDTIFKIFKRLGTPTEAVWPGVEKLPHYRHSFPRWRRQDWATNKEGKFSKQVGAAGLELLDQFLLYSPTRRLSAMKALAHEYFKGVNTANMEVEDDAEY
eukprot:TRINITY_DN3972_c0_g1_i1.p1 TRINITY_DN3972_c0_g1~~TRINITY_DN3972_c0_g1_i1.p1  ORF type:complete len:335 (+),score=104.39 TRINITY_DN3972_c0_g1_i1:94-1098(+)